MKHYPKSYEDPLLPRQTILDRCGAIGESPDSYIKKWRTFSRKAHRDIFDIYVRQLWMEFRFTYNGIRRTKRRKNGFGIDVAFGVFMKRGVGISQYPVTSNFAFTSICSYFKDLFPEFLIRNPFEDADYYKYPYKHVTLDHMCLVYQCKDRLEMLQYAEEKEMGYSDFFNWVANHVLSHNDDVGREDYGLTKRHAFDWTYVKLNEDDKKFERFYEFPYVPET